MLTRRKQQLRKRQRQLERAVYTCCIEDVGPICREILRIMVRLDRSKMRRK